MSETKKTALIIVMLALVISIGILSLGGSQDDPDPTEAGSAQNVEIKDGIQYVTIDAKGGYSPKISTAQAGIPTKLIVRTDGTYDCSAALVIRSIGYENILPQTGEEIIDLGTPEEGRPLQGVCSMGMYNFKINFN